jgi:DNA topoisomerase-1
MDENHFQVKSVEKGCFPKVPRPQSHQVHTLNMANDSSSSSDDEPLAQVAKKAKKKSSTKKPDPVKSSSSAKKKRKRDDQPDKVSSSSTTNGTKKFKKTANGNKKELKKLEKTERLQYAMQAFLWWNAKEPPEGYQWETMEHAGVSFPEEYIPHGVKMLYNGKPVDLTPAQEEAYVEMNLNSLEKGPMLTFLCLSFQCHFLCSNGSRGYASW